MNPQVCQIQLTSRVSESLHFHHEQTSALECHGDSKAKGSQIVNMSSISLDCRVLHRAFSALVVISPSKSHFIHIHLVLPHNLLPSLTTQKKSFSRTCLSCLHSYTAYILRGHSLYFHTLKPVNAYNLACNK